MHLTTLDIYYLILSKFIVSVYPLKISVYHSVTLILYDAAALLTIRNSVEVKP
jgi:hypothetical protein